MKTQKALIIAGKGGVGKTTVAVNMAVHLAQERWEVGLLDADMGDGPASPGVGWLGDDARTAPRTGLGRGATRRRSGASPARAMRCAW